MVTWFKENVLALLLVLLSGVGTYTLAANRITVLEVKMEQQETRSLKTDVIIENNTKALNKIYIIFAKIDGRMNGYEHRIEELEGDE